MKIGFVSWNIKNRPTNLAQIPHLLKSEADYWVVQLIESKGLPLTDCLEAFPKDYYSINLADNLGANELRGQSGIKVFSNLPKNSFLLVSEENRFVVSKLILGRVEVMLVGLHLKSKYSEPRLEDQSDEAQEYYRRFIDESYPICFPNQRFSNSKSRVMFWGDFNMNPFERGMLHQKAFHSSSDLNTVAQNLGRINRANHWPSFYNPMWSVLGDFVPGSGENKLPGSYYFKNPKGMADFHWHMLDGVVFSYPLAAAFDKSTLQVFPLHLEMRVDISKYLNIYSDHFPIKFVLTL